MIAVIAMVFLRLDFDLGARCAGFTGVPFAKWCVSTTIRGRFLSWPKMFGEHYQNVNIGLNLKIYLRIPEGAQLTPNWDGIKYLGLTQLAGLVQLAFSVTRLFFFEVEVVAPALLVLVKVASTPRERR